MPKALGRFFGLLTITTLVGVGTLATVGGDLKSHFAFAQVAPQAYSARPFYNLHTKIDYELLTLQSNAKIRVPAQPSDPLRDVTFFLYANASAPEGRKNLVVDEVRVQGSKVPFQLNGAVLKAQLPTVQTAPFEVEVIYHGVVPRSSASNSAAGGFLNADISGLLGMGGGQENKEKPKNTDYGLYTFGNDILSLGAFWYPSLAVRVNGKWADSQPEGLGDVAYAEMGDYRAQFEVPANVTIVAPGEVSRAGNTVSIQADNLRECAVMMSENFVSKVKTVDVGGKSVRVESYTTKANAKKLDPSLDIAGKSLQIFAKRFGPYLYDRFKIVEAPLGGGAGGMEYSGMTGIASSLYGDLSAQLGGMATTLQLPGAQDLLGTLGDEGGAVAENDANPMTGMLGNVLGQQKEMLDSIFETTIAHEVGHQWFAIGVGSDSQHHPFVDESLVNWATILYFEDRYGKQTADQMTDLHLKTSFQMGAMLGGGDKPANLPTAAYTNNLQYGAVIYGKGALFYQQLRTLVGDEAFFAAVREYYANYQNRIAQPDTLKSLILAKAPTKKTQINALYQRWINEAHGQEDIQGGGLGDMLGGLDLGGLLGGLLGGMGAE